MLSAIARTFAGRASEADPLVQVDELGERRHREALVLVDVALSGLVAEHVRVRCRAVDQPERDAGVAGMQQRALPLDEQHLAPTLDPFEHELLCGTGDEVGDDGVDGDAPARDRDPGLPGRDELAAPAAALRLAVELERHRHLPDRAVGADREDRRRAMRQVRAGRDVQARRRHAQVAQLRRRARAASAASSGSIEMNSCSPFSTSSPSRMQSFSSSRHAGGNRPPCVATPTSAVVGS